MAAKKRIIVTSDFIITSKGKFSIDDIKEYYKDHNRKELADYLKITDRHAKTLIKLAGIIKSKDDCIRSINKGCIEKYGAPTPFESKQIQEKIKTIIIDKYGVENQGQREEVKEKIKTTNIAKYGVGCIFQTDRLVKLTHSKECIDNQVVTKRKNNTFNTSKPEKMLYNILINKFGINDIEQNYNKDLRYPYHCDFYVKSKDLFIELNNHWTHQDHPFDINNTDDVKQLNKIKSLQKIIKGKKNGYYNIEEVWTVRDVEKLNVAKKNNINYVMLYSIKDIENFEKEIYKYE